MRAILWAVAVIACGPPVRILRRLKKAPSAVLLRDKELAAMRNACVARFGLRFVFEFKTLPPERLVPGQRPSQEAKCFSVFQGLMSNPTSLASVSRVSAASPGMANRSMPVFYTRALARQRGRACGCEP